MNEERKYTLATPEMSYDNPTASKITNVSLKRTSFCIIIQRIANNTNKIIILNAETSLIFNIKRKKN
jgi:hypothetical protein|tara:strand:+ start:384 stop:584 length:201 start_codon:yes stop_codon:yes gene_type:complete